MSEPVDALQRVLGAEHAALRVLGVAAARTSRSEAPTRAALLDEAFGTHRARRDAWEELIRDLGEEPAPGAVEYRLPPGTDLGTAVLALESSCAEHYAALVAVSEGDLRLRAMTALESSARAQVRWGGVAVAFPGAPEL